MDAAKTLMGAQKYCGNTYQLFGARQYRLTDGSSDGCRCIDVRTGSGFEYTVVTDRGMDISLATYQGINLTYLTANAEAHPSFYNAWGSQWLYTFTGGLVTTCGHKYLGNPCVDGEEELGLHGRASALPAKEVSCQVSQEGEHIAISGLLQDAPTFGTKLSIRRTVQSQYGQPGLILEDTVTNTGSTPSEMTLLYHINFGYPLLCEDAQIHIPIANCEPYDEYSAQRMQERGSVKAPSGENLEKNYLYIPDPAQQTAAAFIWNPKLLDGLAVRIRFSPEQLPYFSQWLLEDWKDYVLALEPANTLCEPRSVLRERGLLPMLAAGETKTFRVQIDVLQGNTEIEQQIKEAYARSNMHYHVREG